MILYTLSRLHLCHFESKKVDGFQFLAICIQVDQSATIPLAPATQRTKSNRLTRTHARIAYSFAISSIATYVS